MPFQIMIPIESFLAYCTLIRHQARMNEFVQPEVAGFRENLTAHLTTERLFLRVHPMVSNESAHLAESSAAESAVERPFTRVAALVRDHVLFVSESYVAVLTPIWTNPSVQPFVYSEVRFAHKCPVSAQLACILALDVHDLDGVVERIHRPQSFVTNATLDASSRKPQSPHLAQSLDLTRPHRISNVADLHL